MPVIVTGKPKISTNRRQVLPDIDLRQTRFRMDCYISNFLYMIVEDIQGLQIVQACYGSRDLWK